MRRIITILLVFVFILLTGCEAAKESFGEGLSKVFNSGTERVREIAIEVLGETIDEDSSGVYDVVFDKKTGYATIMFRMKPAEWNFADEILQQANRHLILIFPKMLEVKNVQRVNVSILLPVDEETAKLYEVDRWVEMIKAEAERSTIERIDWDTVSEFIVGESLDTYRYHMWLSGEE